MASASSTEAYPAPCSLKMTGSHSDGRMSSGALATARRNPCTSKYVSVPAGRAGSSRNARSARDEAARIGTAYYHGRMPVDRQDSSARMRSQKTGEGRRLIPPTGAAVIRPEEIGRADLNRPWFPRGSIYWEDGVHGKTEEVLTGSPGAGRSVGVRPRAPARLAVGGDPGGCHEDRMHV